MIRSILNFQNLKRTTALGHLVRNCAINTGQEPLKKSVHNSKEQFNQSKVVDEEKLIKSTNQEQKIQEQTIKEQTNQEQKIQEQTIKISNLERSSIDKSTKDLIENLQQCSDLSSLLNLVERSFDQIDDHLTIIFNRLNDLFLKPEYDFNKAMELRKTLNNSSVFASLLDRSDLLIEQLDTKCLITILNTFCLVQNTQNVTLNRIIEQLCNRSKDLQLNEIEECLKYMHYLLRDQSSFANTRFFEFNQFLLRKLKNKILNEQINSNDIKSSINYFFIFLRPENDPNFDVVKHLTEQLLSPDIELSFKHSVLLLKELKLNHFLFKERLSKPKNRLLKDQYKQIELRYKYKTLFPRILGDLIDKCNLKIYETLCLEPNDENFDYFFYKLHNFVDDINHEFPNFYPSKLLFFLTPHLTQNIERNDRLKVNLFDLIQNYSKFNIYDESLLKLAYDQYVNDPKLRSQINKNHFFFTLSRYRFPFVDYQHLSKLLFNYSTQFKQTIENKANPLRTLCELILCDVNDENLFHYLNDTIDNLDKNFYDNFKSVNQFKHIALAKIYLTMFSDLNPHLTSKIEQTLNQSIYYIHLLRRKPMISRRFSRINAKLQRNAYLSNGLYIENLTIYDKSIDDLVPMSVDSLEYYWHKIDLMPLTKDQQLLTLVDTKRLKGNISNYEKTYNHQLKKVLERFNIKPVIVFEEDYKSLCAENQVDFLIQKALDSYS